MHQIGGTDAGRSKRWQRDRTVIGTLRISVVAKMNFTMLRRLFQRLQQAIEGLRGEHVHFVDDLDLVTRRNRAIAHLLDDLSDIIDTGMGGGVHLNHVDMAAFHDRLTMFAGHAQVDGGLVDLGRLVVQRAGENAAVVVLPTPRTPVSI